MLRKRKNRRYNETNDEEGDGERKFDLAEQIKSQRFDQIREKHLQELPGEAVTLRLIQKNGFEKPILVKKPDGLDLRVPPKSFLVRDVRNCVGHQRIIDVMDVKTQKNIEMSMRDWCKYYESKNRDRLLNVISLEFSHTKLDELVESPMIVKLLDWVDLVWPKFLKESQTESTNTIDKMKYPKVQKYCLMSVKGSYTDFHIDFGGTSVWYHILRGKKIFWMVPPTELNLQIFEEWTLSGMQQDVFFGDTVEECFRVELCAGNTFFIPSGWIHAVYTLEDSLVFGGNFLHSFGIENQLKVSRIEDATKVPVKFRYPFYTEILWYVVQHYVYCLTDKDHLHRPDIAVSPTKTKTKTSALTLTLTLKESSMTEKPAIESKGLKSNDIEIEDETTESEHEESDIKKRKALAANKKRGKPSRSTPKKAKEPPTDDESTDIDSANEELIKPAAKPPKQTTNTCRMTKNSLLRLQYEVEGEEQKQLQSSNKLTNKLDKGDNRSMKQTPPAKKKTESNLTSSNMPLNQQQSSNTTTLNITEMMMSNDSKLNGWSGNGGQSIWSNPNSDSKGPKKIHITKIEVTGLKILVKYLSKLSGAKKNLPTLIRNSRVLLDDCRKLIAEHENDDPELAVTGKPITPELFSETKRTDINELIGQFFKPTENTGNDELGGQQTMSPSNNNIIKSKAEISSPSSPSSSSRLKFNHSEAHDKKTNNVSSITTNNTTSTNIMDHNASKSSTQNKETKCLSPNKKLSSATCATSTTSSPPPRPKSPPTRPLSNNQYTSKTKSNNNLLLPGSFADLIAATSTEKKVFDVGSEDVTFSLFGIKDLGSTKSTTNSVHSYNKIVKEKDSNKTCGSNTKIGLTSSPPPATSNSSSTSAGSIAKEIQKPNSPEPPKACIQKRFITPTFRPPNKEKLIYASAPYISPVHASDQSRSTNPYRWQTPAQQQNPSTYSSTNFSPSHPAKPTHSASVSSSSQMPYPLDARAMNQSHLVGLQIHHQNDQSAHHNHNQSQQSVSDKAHVDSNNHKHNNHHQASNNDHSQVSVIVNSNNQQHQQTSSTIDEPFVSSEATIQPATLNSIKTDNKSTDAPKTCNDGESKNKKPTKPRGPPKKSKEARQALESSPAEIGFRVETIPSSSVRMSVLRAEPSSSVVTLAPNASKIKTKRQKKQKDCTTIPLVSTAPPTHATISANSQVKPQTQPSVICSLVTPSTTSGPTGAKINPQSYLISRPHLFNTIPTLSTSQFQQMPSTSMPLIMAPMGSSLGMPLQQGTRIVWAHQGLATPVTNVSSAHQLSMAAIPTTAKIMGPQLARPPVTSNSDNAALLSLATTALSTASLGSSPALSHLSNRAPTSQAIMVNSAANQQALFAGQTFLRPFVPGMPLAHFFTRPGVSRPAGQLVYARLPNQGQPRYGLITQHPGFMQQRFQAPHIVTSQPTSTLAYATFKPPTDPSKAMKTKKVKTS